MPWLFLGTLSSYGCLANLNTEGAAQSHSSLMCQDLLKPMGGPPLSMEEGWVEGKAEGRRGKAMRREGGREGCSLDIKLINFQKVKSQ